MMTGIKKEECFKGWARNGLYHLEILKTEPNNEKALMEVRMSACCCAELDRRHKREETQILQDYVWEHGYLSGNCTYERYENSGYFKEKYRKEN